MAFGQQPTRRIGDDFSAESVITSFDERFRGSVRAQAQRFVGDQFILGEAVMQLGDIKIFGSAARAISKPTTRIISSVSNVEEKSVTMTWAAIRTSARRPCFFANASDVKIAAAAPQVGGQAIRRVMTPGQTTLSFITSSAVTSYGRWQADCSWRAGLLLREPLRRFP